jgi:hypothetical protein
MHTSHDSQSLLVLEGEGVHSCLYDLESYTLDTYISMS